MEVSLLKKTELYVTFDEQYFYFGGSMHYTNGAELKASNKKRDGIDGGSDNFGILLDTFNDKNSSRFYLVVMAEKSEKLQGFH